MKYLCLSEVSQSGWYISVSLMGDYSEAPPKLMDFRYKQNGFMQLVQFDDENVWRSETGHAMCLEQSDYFKEGQDFFFGPIENLRD